MRMLWWMYGKTMRDQNRTEHIRETVGVTHIEGKLMENRLRWYGNVQRRAADVLVWKSNKIAVP